MVSGGFFKVLVVNPGSTSTRVALFVGETSRCEASLPAPSWDSRMDIWEEFPIRLEGIREWLWGEGISKAELAAVVGRGGLLRPVEGGTYRITEAMLSDSRGDRQGAHASNLGCALARAIADEASRDRVGTPAGGAPAVGAPAVGAPAVGAPRVEQGEATVPGEGVPAFVVDPVSTDEFHELARFSGLSEIPRRSLSHALSIHALVREVSKRDGRPLEGSRYVVAHLGGGISVCPVSSGRILDANNANSGGPFSPTRAGGLPTQEFLTLCLSGRYTLSELKDLTVKRGGLVSYLGTQDAREVEERIEGGDDGARMVYEAMAYQIAKEIGAMATVLNGDLEKILLTGGLAASDLLTTWIRERVEFLAPVEVLPEIEEMKALAMGALRVLTGETQAKEY